MGYLVVSRVEMLAMLVPDSEAQRRFAGVRCDGLRGWILAGAAPWQLWGLASSLVGFTSTRVSSDFDGDALSYDRGRLSRGILECY
jgi:hypothetical protein